METLYERLKLSSLKDLLESRGRSACNRKRRDIIAQLVEMDRAERPSVTDRTPDEEFWDRAVRRGLAQYGPNPPPEIIDRVIAAVDATWLEQRGAAAAEVTAAPTEERGEVQIPVSMEVEFQGAGAIGPSPQQQAVVVKHLPPAESLAAGQDDTGCGTQLQLELTSGDGTVVSPQSDPAEELATEQSATSLCSHLAGEGVPVGVDGTVVSTQSDPAEELATEQSATSLCSLLTEEGVPGAVDGTVVSTDTTPENGASQRQEDVGLALQASGDFHLPVDGTPVSTGIPQEWWSVGPDPQHDGLSPVTLSSLQRLKGLQGEGPVQASPQRQADSLRETEVGWVSNALFGAIYLGYGMDTSIGGLDLLTDFGVNPFGVSSCVSLPPKGERCNGMTRDIQRLCEDGGYSCVSVPDKSWV